MEEIEISCEGLKAITAVGPKVLKHREGWWLGLTLDSVIGGEEAWGS